MEGARATGPDGRRHGFTGPIGVAVGPTPHPLSSELVEAALGGAAALGCDAHVVHVDDDQSHLGVLLGIGYPGSFLPVFAGPQRCPRVIWVGEPLLPGKEPDDGRLTQLARSRLMDGLMVPLRPFKDMPLPGPLARARASGTIERHGARNTRAVETLARTVDRVVVTSRDRRLALLEHGIEAGVVPFGYTAATAGAMRPPEGERDLPLVSLGVLDDRFAGRRSVVKRWRDEDSRLTVLDDAWGPARGELLRRTRVVINVHRLPGNFVGIRLVLALAAGAVVVSEPMTDPHPFVPGVHFVEAPIDRLLDAARELLADEPRRRRIAEAGQALLTGELAMERCLGRALDLGT